MIKIIYINICDIKTVARATKTLLLFYYFIIIQGDEKVRTNEISRKQDI